MADCHGTSSSWLALGACSLFQTSVLKKVRMYLIHFEMQNWKVTETKDVF